MRRRDNTSGRTNLYLETATELWCAEIRLLINGVRRRWRKRSKDRREAEEWLTEKERELAIRD